MSTYGLSPRGRGNPGRLFHSVARCRSIPAWAGEPIFGKSGTWLQRVYPRVGGGTCGKGTPQGHNEGLSPRGRGNLLMASIKLSNVRSIPAWAGEPSRSQRQARIGAVYPRVGGGTLNKDGTLATSEGLSPRGRGNPHVYRVRISRCGSIPAWAGEPIFGKSGTWLQRVYPRVGGGTCGKGTPQGHNEGLSPRGRGNLLMASIKLSNVRSIPAWAGEPSRSQRQARIGAVYPRVGGGTLNKDGTLATSEGLSPRGRGNPHVYRVRISRCGSIPAWAGEPGGVVAVARYGAVYPRVGGGTCVIRGQLDHKRGLSPRGRGNPVRICRRYLKRRSIPAWAGEPRLDVAYPTDRTVYPRVGGGTHEHLRHIESRRGLSPRGRGNPPPPFLPTPLRRSIPAWAGEPCTRRQTGAWEPVYPRVGGGTWYENVPAI